MCRFISHERSFRTEALNLHIFSGKSPENRPRSGALRRDGAALVQRHLFTPWIAVFAPSAPRPKRHRQENRAGLRRLVADPPRPRCQVARTYGICQLQDRLAGPLRDHAPQRSNAARRARPGFILLEILPPEAPNACPARFVRNDTRLLPFAVLTRADAVAHTDAIPTPRRRDTDRHFLMLTNGLIPIRDQRPRITFANFSKITSLAQTTSPSSRIFPPSVSGSTKPPAS